MTYESLSLTELAEQLDSLLSDGGTFPIIPSGNSMLPLIRGGRDTVVLSAADKPVPGDVILYRRKDGSYVLHRILKYTADGSYITCGDSRSRTETVCTNQILAKVQRIVRNGHSIESGQRRYRAYIRIWRCKYVRYLYAWFERHFRAAADSPKE